MTQEVRMEKKFGRYYRESDKRHFVYEAEFTNSSWKAVVSDIDGSYHAVIRIQVTGSIPESKLCASVIAWVESSIRDRVGVD